MQAYAAVDANGNIKQDYAYSERISSSGGGGRYTITFGRPFHNPPVVVATLMGGQASLCLVRQVGERSCEINTALHSNPTASDFMIMAIGD
jgi:hypothetical protein